MLNKNFFDRSSISGLRLFSVMLLCGSLTAGGLKPARAQGTDGTVAVVNGDSIPASEFFERLQRMRAQDFIVTINPLTVKSLTSGQILMDVLINERLTIQWASKTNQMPTDAEITTELNKLKTQPGVQQALATHQFSEDVLKNNLRYQRARFNLAVTAASVSPDEVEKYYQAHLANYTTPERWALLALSTRKQADLPKIQADLKAGKPFGETVKKYSEDTGLAARNGDLGLVSSTDPGLPPALKDAVKALPVGETTPPIKLDADGGPGKPKVPTWWFLRVTKKEPAVTRPFAEIKTEVEQQALLERAGGIQVADKKIADFRQVSDIKINLPGYDVLLPVHKK